jgi:hypothetical protein
MTKARLSLKKKHGTPREFEAGCNLAADDLMITTAECDAAVRKYRDEWEEAGKPKSRRKSKGRGR